MSMGKEQEQRLMDLLKLLFAIDAGTFTPHSQDLMSRRSDFGGQEHNDAKTLVYMGWIRLRHNYHVDIMNSWFGEGIYAFELTDDGRAALAKWEASQSMTIETKGPDSNSSQRTTTRPRVMIIHGSRDGEIPRDIDKIQLWCYRNGMEPYIAANVPNEGRFLRLC